MSYILYSSIARAGGIDLLLSMDSFAQQPARPGRRRTRGPGRVDRLRRQSGQGLIALGGALTRWGRRWAPQTGSLTAGRPLTLVAK